MNKIEVVLIQGPFDNRNGTHLTEHRLRSLYLVCLSQRRESQKSRKNLRAGSGSRSLGDGSVAFDLILGAFTVLLRLTSCLIDLGRNGTRIGLHDMARGARSIWIEEVEKLENCIRQRCRCIYRCEKTTNFQRIRQKAAVSRRYS